MSDLKYSRDLNPGPSGEFTHRGVNHWSNEPGLPVLQDKSEYPLGEGLKRPHEQIRVPDRIAFGNFQIPTTQGLILPPTQLAACGTPQTGVLIALTGIVSGLVAPPGLVTINLQNYEGNVYNQAVLTGQTTATVITPFWDLDDCHFPFNRGLYISITTGAAAGTYGGTVSINAIWHA
jgi:hypothetical protein